jgi:cytoskeleton protein RodZ
MDVGTILREARERLGLSIEDVSRRTKISTRVLKGLEQNALDTLPPRVFIRGFVRAYAQVVGLKVDETVQAYLTQLAETPASEPLSHTSASQDLLDEPMVVADRATGKPASESHSAVAGLALAALAFAILGYLGMNVRTAGPGPEVVVAQGTEPARAPEPVPAAPSDTPAEMPHPAVATAADISEPVATTGEGLSIEIHPTGECWVEAVVDGAPRVYRLMQPGERERFTVQDAVTLRVGDPAAFAFSVNGAPGRELGRARQVTTVAIRQDNAATFVR